MRLDVEQALALALSGAQLSAAEVGPLTPGKPAGSKTLITRATHASDCTRRGGDHRHGRGDLQRTRK